MVDTHHIVPVLAVEIRNHQRSSQDYRGRHIGGVQKHLPSKVLTFIPDRAAKCPVYARALLAQGNPDVHGRPLYAGAPALGAILDVRNVTEV